MEEPDAWWASVNQLGCCDMTGVPKGALEREWGRQRSAIVASSAVNVPPQRAHFGHVAPLQCAFGLPGPAVGGAPTSPSGPAACEASGRQGFALSSSISSRLAAATLRSVCTRRYRPWRVPGTAPLPATLTPYRTGATATPTSATPARS